MIAPAFEGHLDMVQDGVVCGWARAKPDAAVAVRVAVRVDDHLIATNAADLFRQDLLEAGIGTGAHAFQITIPPRFHDDERHRISAWIADTSHELDGSPIEVRLAARPKSATHDPGFDNSHLRRLDSTGYETDKWPELLATYEELFGPLRSRSIVLLELGINKGGSLRLWRDYFPHALIVGVDQAPVALADSDRIRIYTGAQEDLQFLDRLAAADAPTGFDVIIDDASHLGEPTRRTFWHLFRRHLKPGGLYCVEDWGTGYWSSWPDGRAYAWNEDSPLREDWNSGTAVAEPRREFASHQHGMVGVLKELVDEVGRGDITKRNRPGETILFSRIAQLRIQPGLAVVIKR